MILFTNFIATEDAELVGRVERLYMGSCTGIEGPDNHSLVILGTSSSSAALNLCCLLFFIVTESGSVQGDGSLLLSVF